MQDHDKDSFKLHGNIPHGHDQPVNGPALPRALCSLCALFAKASGFRTKITHARLRPKTGIYSPFRMNFAHILGYRPNEPIPRKQLTRPGPE